MPDRTAVIWRLVGADVELEAVSSIGMITPLGTILDPIQWALTPDPLDWLGGASVSVDGLAAVSIGNDDGSSDGVLIFDLRDLSRAPLALPGLVDATWGPDDRLALFHVPIDAAVFYELRSWRDSGSMPRAHRVSLDRLEGVAEMWWLADGSGVLVNEAPRPWENPLRDLAILTPDGHVDHNVARLPPLYATASGYDDRPVSSDLKYIWVDPPHTGQAVLIDGKIWDAFEDVNGAAVWNAAGDALEAIAWNESGPSYDLVRSERRTELRTVASVPGIGDTSCCIDGTVFMPDDSFVTFNLDDGTLVIFDIASGQTTVIDGISDADITREDWQLAGIGPGFPAYPVKP